VCVNDEVVSILLHLLASLASTDSISNPLLEYIPDIWLSHLDNGNGPIGGTTFEFVRDGTRFVGWYDVDCWGYEHEAETYSFSRNRWSFEDGN
jgi:hypothetical protein